MVSKTTPAIWVHITQYMCNWHMLLFCSICMLQIHIGKKLKYVKVKTPCENKTVSAPECQWKKDWPHLPLTAPPGSLDSWHPWHLPALALSSATNTKTHIVLTFWSRLSKTITVIKWTHMLNVPSHRPLLASYSLFPFILSQEISSVVCLECSVKRVRGRSYVSMLGWSVEPRIVGR